MTIDLYVGNLTHNASERELQSLFSQFGGGIKTRIIVNKATKKRPKSFAFVEMASDREAQAAVDGLNGHDFGGHGLEVREANPRKSRFETGGVSAVATTGKDKHRV